MSFYSWTSCPPGIEPERILSILSCLSLSKKKKPIWLLSYWPTAFMTYKLLLFLCLTISMECRKLGSDHTNKEVVSWGLGRCDEEVPENHP